MVVAKNAIVHGNGASKGVVAAKPHRPCAVFRGEKQLMIVPVGGKFGPWKVVSVSHGGVVVKTANRKVRLGVGDASAPKVTSTEEPTERNTLQTRRYVPRVSMTASANDTGEGEKPVENPEVTFTLPDAILPKGEEPVPQEAPKEVPGSEGLDM
jgi:hypothetical protein